MHPCFIKRISLLFQQDFAFLEGSEDAFFLCRFITEFEIVWLSYAFFFKFEHCKKKKQLKVDSVLAMEVIHCLMPGI